MGGRRGGETNKQNPQNPNSVSHTQRWLLVESTRSAARKITSFQHYLRYSWLQNLPVYIDHLPQGQACFINQFLTQMKTIVSLQQKRIYTSSNEILHVCYQPWKKASAINYRGYQGPYQYSFPAGYLHVLFPLHHHSSMLSFPEQFHPSYMFIK